MHLGELRADAVAQARLLEVPWSDELLALEPFQRVYERSTGTLVWAGLRVSIGLSRGMAASRKPLKTGRADYFGQLPNTAARLMAACAPGQVRTCDWASGTCRRWTGQVLLARVCHSKAPRLPERLTWRRPTEAQSARQTRDG